MWRSICGGTVTLVRLECLQNKVGGARGTRDPMASTLHPPGVCRCPNMRALCPTMVYRLLQTRRTPARRSRWPMLVVVQKAFQHVILVCTAIRGARVAPGGSLSPQPHQPAHQHPDNHHVPLVRCTH